MGTINSLQPSVDNYQTLLADLKSSSKVARWRLMLAVVATVAYAVEVVVHLATLNLIELSKNTRFGTPPWFVDQALKFQYGDTLVFLNDQYKYAVIDETKCIIKRAACDENGNTVLMKVAKLVSGVPTKLDALELAAYEAFVAKTKPPGKVDVISDDADEVRLYLKIVYDPLLLDNTGQLISSPGTYPVNDAVTNFISNLNVYNFNGSLELATLCDAIQAAPGVKFPYVLSASARYGTNPFNVFTERYKANAGHLVVDPTQPLSSTVTYSPASV